MDKMEKESLDRVKRLEADEMMERIGRLRVIVFGVGGVGSWCAESLVRSGVKDLTIVDPDKVSVTNINRQAMATADTVSMVKVEAMRQRLLSINPNASIRAVEEAYSADNADDYDLSAYDYVIDAIDSLQDKMTLILNATKADCRFFSSMGAALKLDPQKIKVGEFWTIKGCPLARALRKRMKKAGRYPDSKFKCVYSTEVLPNLGEAAALNALSGSYADSHKGQVNGTLAHITAIFGFTLAGMVLQDALRAPRG